LFKNDCQDIVALFCNFFHNYVNENSCGDLCSNIFGPISILDIGSSVEEYFPGLPNEHCRVEINDKQKDSQGVVTFEETFVIENLVLVDYILTNDGDGNPDLTVSINGKECLQCNIV